MDDTNHNDSQSGDDAQPNVTGLTSSDRATDSNARNFHAPGAGGGQTGFSGSGAGRGTTGFDQTGGQGDEAGDGAAFSSDPDDTVTGFSRNSQGPGSHGAAMEAPGTGKQKTGFSNVESNYTGFEGGGGGGGGNQDDRSVDVGSAMKDKLGQLKDKLSSSSD